MRTGRAGPSLRGETLKTRRPHPSPADDGSPRLFLFAALLHGYVGWRLVPPLAGWSGAGPIGAGLLALIMVSAAYMAETIRAGIQAVPKGQTEAARSLGMSAGRTTATVILPQAFRIVIPPLTNTVIVMVKNTSLVLVVGLFDLLSSGRAAATDPAWPSPYSETYLFVGMIYFLICFGISRYSRWLEQRTSQA